MITKAVLRTGSTGATGGFAIGAPLEIGDPVRSLVRKYDERAARLREMGFETQVGHSREIDDVRAAMEGASTAHFVFPLLPDLVTAPAYSRQAATKAGLQGIVNMSQISASRNSRSQQTRHRGISDCVLDWSAVPVTHLRPAFFPQWLTRGTQVRTISEASCFRLPFGIGRHAPIAAEDQGRLIAAVLSDPAQHAGKTHELCCLPR